MKKYLAILFISLSMVVASCGGDDTTKETNGGCQYGQCKATAASTGERCKHCVSNQGDSYCYQHD